MSSLHIDLVTGLGREGLGNMLSKYPAKSS